MHLDPAAWRAETPSKARLTSSELTTQALPTVVSLGWADAAHADHHIGRVLDYLEESGQRENTMVIVVSDNGASGEGSLL